MSFIRRRVLVTTIGLAAVALIVAGAWLLWPRGCTERPSVADLMLPGPLGEKSQGSAEAPVTLIEYASLTCTHCARFATTVHPTLKSRYIDTGKVRFIMREYPLDDLALAAAALARHMEGEKYFELIDQLFRAQADWAFVPNPAAALLRIARQAGLTQESFEGALTNQHILDGILSAARRGHEKFCVGSTPTFFINGTLHRGGFSVDELDRLVEPLLKR